MRDERSDLLDGGHIWLRQSVTFTVNGQTRTVEMGLPLRPGATPDEVEALLDEADAGMRRLSRRLDAHLAELNSATPAPQAAPQAAPREAPVPTRPLPQPSAAETPAPAAPQSGARAQAAAEQAEAPTRQPRPEPERPAPQRPPAAGRAETPTPAPAPATPAPAPATSGGPDLTRAEFIAAIGKIGLDPRQAMERLGVRSLTGLNLREALEALRRQLVREGSGVGEAEAPEVEQAAPASGGEPLGFEEEDDLAFGVSYPDEVATPQGVFAAESAEDEDLDEDALDDFGDDEDEDVEGASLTAFAPAPVEMAGADEPLADVPNLEDLRRDARFTRASALPSPAPRRPAERARPHEIAETPAPAPVEPVAEVESPQARADRLIGELRAARGGGAPVAQQRTAFKNIVVHQLGEQRAATLTKELWGVTPERLGPEQLDAINRWGKQDAFEEEAKEVVAALRAARAASQSGQATTAPTPTEGAPAAQKPAPRSAARPRPATQRGDASREGRQRQGER